MADALRVRIYNVLFGDAILLTIPEEDEKGRKTTVNVLIDVGNALTGEGGRDEVFEAVLENIKAVLGTKPIDLYVMTHEHMDHIQGLLYGSRKLNIAFKAKRVWMTASAEGDAYYSRFPKARKKKLAALAAYEGVAAFLAKSGAALPDDLQGLLGINNPRASDDCVAYLKDLGPSGAKPVYVNVGAKIDGQHPFRRTKVSVLAPEADTSIYYGPLPPRTTGILMDGAVPTALDAKAVTPPAGVSAGDFFDLVEFRSDGMWANLRSIDKAANNSSVVLKLEWNGWKLLFPGDAEEKSWEMMDRRGLLEPVHFLKVSHHGSKNGSPPRQLDKVLPDQAPDKKGRVAVVSTHEDSYPGVPNGPTLALLKSRAQLADTREVAEGGWVDVLFPADLKGKVKVVPGP